MAHFMQLTDDNVSIQASFRRRRCRVAFFAPWQI
jgi:hypothetical protein